MHINNNSNKSNNLNNNLIKPLIYLLQVGTNKLSILSITVKNNLKPLKRHKLNNHHHHHQLYHLLPNNSNNNHLNSHHSIHNSFRMLLNRNKVQKLSLIFNHYLNNLQIKINNKVIFYNSLGNKSDSNFLDKHIKVSFSLLDLLHLG